MGTYKILFGCFVLKGPWGAGTAFCVTMCFGNPLIITTNYIVNELFVIILNKIQSRNKLISIIMLVNKSLKQSFPIYALLKYFLLEVMSTRINSDDPFKYSVS